jgi:hypothetical protein
MREIFSSWDGNTARVSQFQAILSKLRFGQLFFLTQKGILAKSTEEPPIFPFLAGFFV